VVTAGTVEAMRALGARMARLLRPGDLVVLLGELGAGKTTLVQGIGAGLGVDGPVTSPTFVIDRVHRGGRVPLVHADAYRLGGVAEVDDLDLDATVEESVTLVEWGAGLVEGLAADRLEVRITRPDEAGDETRRLELTGVGPRWSGVDLAAAIAG
jgi:tRNA threonylcarbamoyladenosine biosynthesis protein TsaE